MYQVYGLAIAQHIDNNGLPHTPRLLVTMDMKALLKWAGPQVVDLMDQIFGGEHEEITVSAAVAHLLHGLETDEVVDLFEQMELEVPEESGQPTLIYVCVGTDPWDVEDKLTDKVGEIDEDDDEDELDEAYLEEEGDLEEDDED